jgi:hypothetical protein
LHNPNNLTLEEKFATEQAPDLEWVGTIIVDVRWCDERQENLTLDDKEELECQEYLEAFIGRIWERDKRVQHDCQVELGPRTTLERSTEQKYNSYEWKDNNVYQYQFKYRRPGQFLPPTFYSER